MNEVRQHYERFPYPPIPAAALPRRGQGVPLSWEYGSERAFGERSTGRGRRILVVGAGTLEALVVGLANPRAQEVVALDLSARSLARLKRRVALVRARQWVLGLASFNAFHRYAVWWLMSRRGMRGASTSSSPRMCCIITRSHKRSLSAWRLGCGQVG